MIFDSLYFPLRIMLVGQLNNTLFPFIQLHSYRLVIKIRKVCTICIILLVVIVQMISKYGENVGPIKGKKRGRETIGINFI